MHRNVNRNVYNVEKIKRYSVLTVCQLAIKAVTLDAVGWKLIVVIHQLAVLGSITEVGVFYNFQHLIMVTNANMVMLYILQKRLN